MHSSLLSIEARQSQQNALYIHVLKAKLFEGPCCCVIIGAVRTELLCSAVRAVICKFIQLPQTPPRSMAVFFPRGELNSSSCISSDTVCQEINSAFIFILMSQAIYWFLIRKQWEGKRARLSVKEMGSRKCEKIKKNDSSCCESGICARKEARGLISHGSRLRANLCKWGDWPPWRLNN